MSNEPQDYLDPEDVPSPSRRALLRRAAGSGALLSVAATLGLPSAAHAADQGAYPSHPKWNFVFVNHVSTNPFFVPTQYGIADACALLGCTYQWTGSQTSVASEMVNSMNAAIASKADGIAVALVDRNAFNAPVDRALKQGIPVFSYNADVDNNRLAYVGQELFLAGKAVGQRMVELVGSGEVAGFIATPGQLNIQPRLDGAKAAIEESGKDITLHETATGATINEEFSRVESFYLGHQNLKGMFAVDAGSTAAVAKTMKKHGLREKGVRGGGFDLLPGTLTAIDEGYLDFTVDQQAYLQGFYTVMELFMFKVSGGLTGPGDINTGLKFVTSENVTPYLETESRFQGNAEASKLLERSGPIAVG